MTKIEALRHSLQVDKYDLERKLFAIEAQLQLLDKLESPESQPALELKTESSTSEIALDRPLGPLGKAGLTEAIIWALTKIGESSVPEIRSTMENAGFKSSGKNIGVMIFNTLTRLQKDGRVSKGDRNGRPAYRIT